MRERRRRLLEAGNVLTEHLSGCPCVTSVVCFGSVAMTCDDELSDLDLYVFCDPLVMPDKQRRELLSGIPGMADLQVGATSAGFENDWMAVQDKLRTGDLPCDWSCRP